MSGSAPGGRQEQQAGRFSLMTEATTGHTTEQQSNTGIHEDASGESSVRSSDAGETTTNA